MGRRGHRWLEIALAAAVLAASISISAAPTEAADAPTGAVPSAIAERYLATTPELGPVTVINVAGEPADRKLLAATLQGIVNRSQARIYLLGMRSVAEDQYWLTYYQDQGLISTAATVGLDAALATFASEAAGYVLADPAEPWTVNTATSAAAATGSVVATPSTVGAVSGAGLAEVDDHRGRWGNALSAYQEAATQYRGDLDYPGVALQQPDRHAPRDLYVQQGVLTMYTRPSQADFDGVYDIVDTYPPEHPVYGYVSDTGEEEVTAVARLALAGRFLIPTDTTDNLSLHLAVGGDTRALPEADDREVEPCSPDVVNVALAVSDGDNMVIPEAYFPRDNAWNSSRRGELGFGWGISPAASILMPSVWDHYISTATANDEVVDIMGLGYTFPSVMPNGAEFLTDGSRLRRALGIDVHWSLDALIREPDADGWADWGTAIEASGGAPAGILLNYVDFGGPTWFRGADDVPVLSSQQSNYDNGPAELAAQVATLVDLPDQERALVNFFAITVWTSSYDEIVDAMAPYQDNGVRFLTPGEAFACLPEPPASPTTPTDVPPTSVTPTGGAALPAQPVSGQARYTG